MLGWRQNRREARGKTCQDRGTSSQKATLTQRKRGIINKHLFIHSLYLPPSIFSSYKKFLNLSYHSHNYIWLSYIFTHFTQTHIIQHNKALSCTKHNTRWHVNRRKQQSQWKKLRLYLKSSNQWNDIHLKEKRYTLHFITKYQFYLNLFWSNKQ